MKINRLAYEVYVETSEGRRTYGATNIEAVCEILREKLPEDWRADITPGFVEAVARGDIRTTGKVFGINHPFHIHGD